MYKKRLTAFLALIMICVTMFAGSMTAYAVETQPPTSAGEEGAEGEVNAPEVDAPVQDGRPTGENTVISDDLLVSMDWSEFFPSSVTGERFNGGGTLVDYVVTGNKHFYTIVAREGHTFYLILDYDKDENNVYFLTEVSQDSLAYVEAEQARQGGGQAMPSAQPQTNIQVPQAATEAPQSNEGGKFPTMLVLMLVLIFGIIGIGYYSKIYKPKQQKKQAAHIIEEAENDKIAEDSSDDTDFFDDGFEYEDDK